MSSDWLSGGTPPGYNSTTSVPTTASASGGGLWGGFLDTIGTGFGLYMQNESLEFEREVKLRELELENRTTQQTLDPASAAALAQAGGFKFTPTAMIAIGVGVVGLALIMRMK